MGDFAQVFGGLLHAANERTATEKKKYETQRDADVAMYRQIMLDPHAGLGPDADAQAVEERRTKIAGDMAKLQNLKGKDTPIHHLAEMLNGVRRAVKARQGGPAGQAAPQADPGMSGAQPIPLAKPGDGKPEPIPNAKPGGKPGLTPLSGGAPGTTTSPVDQSTQKVQQKTQSLGGKILTKAAHGLGAGLTALDSSLNRYDTRSLPGLDTSVMPTAPTRVQDATMAGTAEKAQKDAARENEMKIYRDQLHEANPRMTEDQLDRAVETKFGAIPKPKSTTKKFSDPNSPTGFSYGTFDPNDPGTIISMIPGAPSGDTSGVSEQIVIDPNTGEMKAVPIYKSTTHSIGGKGTPGPQAKKGLTPLDAGAGGTAGGKAVPGAKPAGAKPSAGGKGGGARLIGNYIKPQQFNSLNTQAIAIDEARNSLVGDDPANPNGGLSADLGVFDNPDSIERIQNYLGFIEKNVAGEANAAGAAGPLAAAEWYAQLPVAVSNLQQQAQQELAMQLTPEEQTFVTDYFRVMGTIGGLRAATKMPGSRWSFMNLYNELPTPGRVNNKQDAMRRIQNIVKETNVVGGRNPMTKKVALPSLDGGNGAQPQTKGYRIPGNPKLYNIPADQEKEFLKDHPEAKAVGR